MNIDCCTLIIAVTNNHTKKDDNTVVNLTLENYNKIFGD